MRDLSDPEVVRAACVRSLGWGLNHARPDVEIDHYGNVQSFGGEANFLPYMFWAYGAGELGEWKYLELDFEEYTRAVASSPALTINCFGPLLMAGLGFSIGDDRGLYVDSFEPRTRNGFEHADEPHLDVVARGTSGRMVIEPTCIDYLAPKWPKATNQSEAPITTQGVDEPWAAEMLRIREGAQGYRLLDAEHLIELALSVSRFNPDEPATLVYLYWEPMDEFFSPLFEEHRQEITEFAWRVGGGSPEFVAMSWFDLWNDWAETGDPLLQQQVAELRARYEVPAWAWEGVSWVNGRLDNTLLDKW